MISPACCCNICFNCRDQDWFMRGCQFEGHPVELADLLTNTVFNFGRLDEAPAFSGAFRNWVSKELSVVGQWDTTDNHGIMNFGTTSLYWIPPGGTLRPYQGATTGHVRLTLRISDLKLRLMTWGELIGGGCKHAIRLQIQWKQTITAIESMNIRLTSQLWGVPSYTFTDTSTIKAVGTSFLSLVDLVGLESVNSFSNAFYPTLGGWGAMLYSDDCDHQFHVSPISKDANLWVPQFESGAFGSVGYLRLSMSLNSAQWAHDHHPTGSPRLILRCFQPQWIGSQVSQFSTWGTPAYTLQPDYTKLPTIVKRSNSWGVCTNLEPPPPEPEEPLSLQQLYVSGEPQYENIWAG